MDDILKILGMTEESMLALTLDLIVYKLGGLTLTQEDAVNFLKSNKEVKLDLDEEGSLVYTLVDREVESC